MEVDDTAAEDDKAMDLTNLDPDGDSTHSLSGEAVLIIDQTGESLESDCIENLVIHKTGQANLEEIGQNIEAGKLLIVDYKVIILHVGTKDMVNVGYTTFNKKLPLLVDAIQQTNPSAHVCVTSMLPRPTYTTATCNKLARTNTQLKSQYQKRALCSYLDLTPLVMNNGSLQNELFDGEGVAPTAELTATLRDHIQSEVTSLLDNWAKQSPTEVPNLKKIEAKKSLPSTFKVVTDVINHRTERELVVFPLSKLHLEMAEVKTVLDKCQNYTVRYLNPPPGTDGEVELFVEMLLRCPGDKNDAVTVFKNLKAGVNNYNTNTRRKGKMIREWSKHYVREPAAGQEYVLSLIGNFLYVDNVPRTATEHDICPLFPGCADVIIPPHQEGDTRFCYVQCPESDDVDTVARQKDGVDLGGHALNVQVYADGGPSKKTDTSKDVPQSTGTSMSTNLRTLHEGKLIGILGALANNKVKTQQEKAKMVSKLVYFFNSLKVDDENRKRLMLKEWVNTKQATVDMLLQKLRSSDDSEIQRLLKLENFQFPKAIRRQGGGYRGGYNPVGVAGGGIPGGGNYRGRGGGHGGWNNPVDHSGFGGHGEWKGPIDHSGFDGHGEWNGPPRGRGGFRMPRCRGDGWHRGGGRGGRGGGWIGEGGYGHDMGYSGDDMGAYGMGSWYSREDMSGDYSDIDDVGDDYCSTAGRRHQSGADEGGGTDQVIGALQGMMGEIGKLMSNLNSGGGGSRGNHGDRRSFGRGRGANRGVGPWGMSGRLGDYYTGGM